MVFRHHFSTVQSRISAVEKIGRFIPQDFGSGEFLLCILLEDNGIIHIKILDEIVYPSRKSVQKL